MQSFTFPSLILTMGCLLVQQDSLAGTTPPLTNNDLSLEAAINSSNALMDVLSNDDSGVNGNDFKEVIAVCDSSSSDQDCLTNGTSFSNATGTVTVNGSGDDNNVLFTSTSTTSAVFGFKYIMENSTGGQGSAQASVDLYYYEVNVSTDNGTGGCTAAECTLREALVAAQGEAGPSNVLFDRDFNATITLTSGLTIDDTDLNVTGPGANQLQVSGDDQFRVFDVTSASERINLSGFTVTAGMTTGNGAGIRFDGARDVLVENMRIVGNSTTANGGGIWFASGSGTIRNVEISDNFAGTSGGGIGMQGSFGSDVTMENVTISSNLSDDEGAGFYINAGNGQNVTLRHITSAFNSTGSQAVAANKVESSGNFNMESSLVVSNSSELNMLAGNNVINNSIIDDYSGATIVGSNNQTGTSVALNPLASLNDTGLKVHSFDPGALAEDFVDDMVGNVGCGSVVPNDQIGTPRPVGNDCDAGAYEYIFIDVIFISTFD